MNLDKAPHFFERCCHALKSSQDEAQKKNRKHHYDSKLTSTPGFEIQLAKQSARKVPKAKQPPTYTNNMSSIQQYIKKKRNKKKKKLKKMTIGTVMVGANNYLVLSLSL